MEVEQTLEHPLHFEIRAVVKSQNTTQVCTLQKRPPWGEYFGVVSQGVKSAAAATEVEVTVVTMLQSDPLHKPLALEQNVSRTQLEPMYQPMHLELFHGENDVPMCATAAFCIPLLLLYASPHERLHTSERCATSCWCIDMTASA